MELVQININTRVVHLIDTLCAWLFWQIKAISRVFPHLPRTELLHTSSITAAYFPIDCLMLINESGCGKLRHIKGKFLFIFSSYTRHRTSQSSILSVSTRLWNFFSKQKFELLESWWVTKSKAGWKKYLLKRAKQKQRYMCEAIEEKKIPLSFAGKVPREKLVIKTIAACWTFRCLNLRENFNIQENMDMTFQWIISLKQSTEQCRERVPKLPY